MSLLSFLYFSLLILATPVPPPRLPRPLSFGPSPHRLPSPTTSPPSLNARPPPAYHIDGHSPHLPEPYRIAFLSYGADIPHPQNAHRALDRAFSVMLLMGDLNLMTAHERVYAAQDVVLTIDPGPRLRWGYWGEALRALGRLWVEYDVFEIDFVIIVEGEGVVGKGFVQLIPPAIIEGVEDRTTRRGVGAGGGGKEQRSKEGPWNGGSNG